jgi:DNA polymerase elongation subunit (family B)
MSSSDKKVVKVKRTVTGKSFRLVDFHIYDQRKCENIDTSSDDNLSVGSGGSSNNHATVNQDKRKFNSDPPKFVIQMFGLNEKGETCSIFIDDYKPFFYIRVGDNWTQSDATALGREIGNRVGKYHSSAILSLSLVEHHKLYGFSGGRKHKFVKIVFQNTSAMNKVKNLWYTNLTAEERAKSGDREYRKLTPLKFAGVTLELYESQIPPLLRYFHIENISPSGWVFVNTAKARVPDKLTTTCTYEYICETKSVIPQPEKETRVPYKICSFDIEASSSHGDFPLPVKTYKRLASNIVDVFLRMSSSAQKMDETRAKTLLKRCILTAFGMDHFENVDLVYPKKVPTKPRVLEWIEVLLTKSIKNAKTANEEEDNHHLLEIDRIFEQIKSTSAQANGQSENPDGDNGGENDGDEDNEPSGSGSTMEVDTAPVWTKFNKTTIKSLGKAETTTTIVDVLLNAKHDREAKIQFANEVLTLLFPRLEGDKVTFIGSTFLRYGEPEPYLNHCLVLGSCDKVDGAVIQSTTSERELLLEWRNLIQQENPDIIIGYNIFGFDYEFMFRRAQENGCERSFLMLSRKQGELCAKPLRTAGQNQWEEDDGTAELAIENTKIVLATGEYDLRFFKMTGRIQVDMYTYFRRDFNLASYKLDDVAGQYISDDVKRVEHVEHHPTFGGPVTELFSGNLTGLHAGDFIHIELSGFTSDYYKNGKKFRVLNIEKGREVQEVVKGKECVNKYNVITIEGLELKSNGGSDAVKNIKWGMAKDDVTPQDIFRLAKGSSADRAVVAKYCIQDCNLVHHLMSKIDVITGYIEMSRICSVPIPFLVFRGQGIKLTSYVAKKCREKNTLMPDLEKTSASDGYEGAIVLPPKCSMYMDNPVACVDYASLYPSSMISQNYSHDSKVWTKEYDTTGTLIRETGERDASGNYIFDGIPEYQYIDIEFDTFKTFRRTPTSRAEKVISGKKVCRWAQLPNGQKSIMPAILEELLDARKKTRKQIKTEPDPFMQNILDKRQLGYKVTANSLYGQCGARTSTFYEKDVAASTTATGRMMITYAKRMIEEVYGDRLYPTANQGVVKCKAEYVYGDTDSVFFTFNLENPETGEKIRGKPALEATIEIAQDVANLCTYYLKSPMELTYEKTLMPFILLSKKRYVGMLYETDPTKGKLKYMGLSLKRRDSCDYLKDTYGGILNILMKENDIQKAIEFLNQSLENLIAGTVPMEKLTITKALRSDYKNPLTIGHWVLADRIGKRDPGNKPKPGDRMKFVFIVNNARGALMGDKIETPDFILEKGLSIDYTHYITNQLMKPLQQLFGLALEPIWKHNRKTAAISTFKKDMAKLEEETPDIESFMKRKEKYCSAKIKTLIFDKFLSRIEHSRTGIQTLEGFFAKK